MAEKGRCNAITGSGTRCKGIAIDSSGLCHAHHPDRAEQRRRNAVAGGKARSGRTPDELAEAKRQIRTVTDDVLRGRVDKAVAAVAFQGMNTYLRAVEVQRKLDGLRALEDEVGELRGRLDEVRRRRDGWAN